MEKVDKVLKDLQTQEKKYYILRILTLTKEVMKYNEHLKYIKQLLENSIKLSSDLRILDNTKLNIIDNNVFEIENIIEEIELDYNPDINLFVYLNNKSLDYLKKLYASLINILNEEKAIKNAISTIKTYQKSIIISFINKLYNYLKDTSNYKLLQVLNIENIHLLLNQPITLNEWKYIYKTTNTIVKSIDNYNSEYEKLLEVKFQFEVSFFILSVEE